MIRKKLAPDLIRGGDRFSEKDHASSNTSSGNRFSLKRLQLWARLRRSKLRAIN